MFADDTTLSAIIPAVDTRNSVHKSLQDDLEGIAAWAEDWLVIFNSKKTQLMTISRKKDAYDIQPLMFLGDVLEETDSIKLVGICISDKLNWGKHVDKLAKHAGQRVGIIRKAKYLLPNSALASLYKSKVRSVMEYCSPIWQSAPGVTLTKLDAIQRKAIHCMGEHGDTIPNFNMYKLAERRQVSGGCQLYRMFHGIAPPAVCELLPNLSVSQRYSRQVANRHHLQLSVTRSRTEHHMNSFVPSYVRLWNSLPNDVIYGNNGDLLNLEAFKRCLNRFLLASR